MDDNSVPASRENAGNDSKNNTTSDNDNRDAFDKNSGISDIASKPFQTSLNIVTTPLDTTAKSLPTGSEVVAASHTTSDVFIETSASVNNVLSAPEMSRYQISNSELLENTIAQRYDKIIGCTIVLLDEHMWNSFTYCMEIVNRVNMDDQLNSSTTLPDFVFTVPVQNHRGAYPDSARTDNRSRENRLSAPTPYRPVEHKVPVKPRSNSHVIPPSSMHRYNSTMTVSKSDGDFTMLSRILNWPNQPNQGINKQLSEKLSSSGTNDNLVNDGEIIFDTLPFSRTGDRKQFVGKYTLQTHSRFPIPQGRSLVNATMHQNISPLTSEFGQYPELKKGYTEIPRPPQLLPLPKNGVFTRRWGGLANHLVMLD
ncbi:4478_t:CDS:2 [Acaulospora morrowiae]|uniref:4478_t:CDS:1 n=1 Tax=Acaulospora morrowiae TaxID=94023 RepID=A0A9N8ZKQ4_9GLOM|nr:4478_t:CDS:2 [Acaulospora morrowiae]